MIRLSILTRQALAKLTLPLLLLLACGLVVLGQADRRVAERARVAVSDALAPLYGLMARPLSGLRDAGGEAQHLVDVAAENERLRAENMRLRRWYNVAVALQAENAQLKDQLHWMPDPAPSFVTARAVADTGGVYARSLLVSLPGDVSISKGEVAVDASGLMGRVTEVGTRSARILLINDITSRVPVTLTGSHASAMMVGTNNATPRLMYFPEDVHPAEGERVVTSSEADALPAGLPVGTVHYERPGMPVVEPFAALDRPGIVRLFDYGLTDIVPPEAAARVGPRPAGRGAVGPVPGAPGGAAAPVAAPPSFPASHGASGEPAVTPSLPVLPIRGFSKPAIGRG
ncbi:rod shape-determining protein MreC [Rhizosaccharibacter radicis]|uniref:Cell shape-determining protein MreC n=1 Tax=Rhizosaccharibacter radicis TaxID=2782605 RepID=A0ABT1VWR8_9PROT|nr:rod shape-determining protein MreC [Acetobacteraceae bacterium KSS12]